MAIWIYVRLREVQVLNKGNYSEQSSLAAPGPAKISFLARIGDEGACASEKK